MAECKRCNLKTSLSESDIQKMVDEVTNMKGVRLAQSSVYSERFEKCQGCEHFLYGSTCSVCGCVMQVRARLIQSGCPKKKW